jgi:hypothetical protein
MKLPMLTTDQKIAEIRRLYFSTTRHSIQLDLEKALDLLKSIPNEEERERATVYMDGMAQMRRDWGGSPRNKGKGQGAEGKGQRAEGRGQREGKGQREDKGQRAEGTGQRAGNKAQQEKGERPKDKHRT